MKDVLKATDELVSVLRRTGELIDLLLESSGQKEEFLKSDEIVELNDLLSKEEDVVSALGDNEKARQSSTETLAAAVKVSGEDVSLRELCEAIEDPELRTKLEGAREELARKTEQLTQQNVRVRELLQFKLNYTNYLINLLYIPKTNMFSYNVQGDKEDEGDKLNLMDVRV